MDTSDKKRKSLYEGVLPLGDTELNVAVLDDGTRLISRNAIFRAFGRTKRGRAKDEVRAPNRPSFIDARNLQPLIDSEADSLLYPIEYVEKDGKTSTGYNALILPKLCKVYLDARSKINPETNKPYITKSQLPLAHISETVLIALSTIGIIALIDEATGYQYDREKDELQKILKLWVSPEILDWQKEFKLDFYREIYRLRRWPFTPENINKRPQVIGKYTIQYIYSQLPPGVLDFIKKRTPKSAAGNYLVRLHQSLTPEVGKEHLRNQLIAVTTLLSISRSWTEFNNLFLRKYGQTEIDFDAINLSIKEAPKPKELTTPKINFDQNLKGLLAVPPPKKEKEG